ncbi:unnamed protein product, partial [Meganyctiphanes norvegica]
IQSVFSIKQQLSQQHLPATIGLPKAEEGLKPSDQQPLLGAANPYILDLQQLHEGCPTWSTWTFSSSMRAAQPFNLVHLQQFLESCHPLQHGLTHSSSLRAAIPFNMD